MARKKLIATMISHGEVRGSTFGGRGPRNRAGWLYSGNACSLACARSRRGWAVPGGDHALRAALQPPSRNQPRGGRRGERPLAARLLSGEQDDSLVGDFAVDCLGGD